MFKKLFKRQSDDNPKEEVANTNIPEAAPDNKPEDIKEPAAASNEDSQPVQDAQTPQISNDASQASNDASQASNDPTSIAKETENKHECHHGCSHDHHEHHHAVLNEHDYRKLAHNGYEAIKGTFDDIFTIQHKITGSPNSGKIAEIRAASSVHACKLLGWRPNQCTVLKQEKAKNRKIDIQFNSKVIGSIEIPSDKTDEEIVTTVLNSNAVVSRLKDKKVTKVSQSKWKVSIKTSNDQAHFSEVSDSERRIK